MGTSITLDHGLTNNQILRGANGTFIFTSNTGVQSCNPIPCSWSSTDTLKWNLSFSNFTATSSSHKIQVNIGSGYVSTAYTNIEVDVTIKYTK